MFVRKLTLCVVLFCLVSLFVGVPFADAHPSQESRDAVKEAEEDRDSAWNQQLIWNKRYNGAFKAVETLLSAWDKNAESIKSNKWDVANTVAATAISMILEAVLTDDPGGGGSLKSEWFKELAENLPTLLTAINAGKETAELIGDLSVRESYLLSLTTAVSALDKIISENQIDFDVYEKEYDNYVEKVQDHAGGIVREPNHSSSGDYSAYTALTLKKIKDMVKHKDAWDRDPKKNDLKFWYHIDELKESSQASSFSFNRFKVFDPN